MIFYLSNIMMGMRLLKEFCYDTTGIVEDPFEINKQLVSNLAFFGFMLFRRLEILILEI
jgi:hypothetical protein